MYFKDKLCEPVKVGITVSGQYVHISKTAVHLGHTISSENKNVSVKSSTRTFGGI